MNAWNGMKTGKKKNGNNNIQQQRAQKPPFKLRRLRHFCTCFCLRVQS